MACCESGGSSQQQQQNAARSLPYKFLFKYIIVGDTGMLCSLYTFVFS